ncbi:MAG TPA: hypothetical protein DIS82_14610 [Exiguobacterium sp.]|uniref:hypothetical protein n=1 Tax=unclassified Exiguobacterium TaxID=2644629 RepID=UPI000ED04F0D|nr:MULTISPECIES: hypothetical protein [unclassified Exiguobacterium]HCN59382.1 hypothetical protein [Exiguobacterium sp.]
MSRQQTLLTRLDQIGQQLEQTNDAWLLLGLGSVGRELERLDAYSDLDFFVITKPGQKQRFLDRLDWLESVHPLSFIFQNTVDGFKLLFADGIYGECAIFELDEMPDIAFSPGRIVWQDPTFPGVDLTVSKQSPPPIRRDTLDFALNEALTNLYVGLCRYARGERLSGLQLVEQHAFSNLLSILHLIEPEVVYYPDAYGNERRAEQRFPQAQERFTDVLQGYARVPESALALLDWLEQILPVNSSMAAAIRRLAAECQTKHPN